MEKLLTQRLAEIEEAFPELAQLVVQNPTQIAAYYTASSWGYTWVHSRQGAIHMALSRDGIFRKDDYLNQAREVLAFIQEHHAGGGKKILEVGCGRGFNLGFLAAQQSENHFTGIDLTPNNLAFARKKHGHWTNLQFIQNDFHTLHSLQGQTYDVIFAVETLCHVLKPTEVLCTLAKHLKPGGSLIVYDAYRTAPHAPNPQLERALKYTELAMAVPRFANLNNFLNLAEQEQLFLTSKANLTEQIQPNLKRLEPYSQKYFKSWILKYFTNHLFPKELVRNAVAGYLMPLTFQPNLHEYFCLIFRKKN